MVTPFKLSADFGPLVATIFYMRRAFTTFLRWLYMDQCASKRSRIGIKHHDYWCRARQHLQCLTEMCNVVIPAGVDIFEPTSSSNFISLMRDSVGDNDTAK